MKNYMIALGEFFSRYSKKVPALKGYYCSDQELRYFSLCHKFFIWYARKFYHVNFERINDPGVSGSGYLLRQKQLDKLLSIS